MNQKDTQKLLKQRLSLGLPHGIKSMEEVLVEESIILNEFIHCKSQYNDLKNLMNQNLLPYEQVEIALNKIRTGILGLIDRISESDLEQKANPPKLRNTEMQYRKNNFFKLLEIHFQNLEAVEIVLTNTYGGATQLDERIGRYAFDFVYKDVFYYNYFNPNSREKELVKDIKVFSHDFFFLKYRRFEVYMKTVKLILNYILEEEMEQVFYLSIMESILSTTELQTIFYYSLGDEDTELKNILVESKLLEKNLPGKLMKEDHWELWNNL